MHSTVDGHLCGFWFLLDTITILVQVNIYMQFHVGVDFLGHRLHIGSVLLGPAS